MTELIFSSATSNPRFVVQALTAVAWKDQEDQYCSASVSENGILILTEDCATIQASVLLRAGLFSNFSFIRNENFEFPINLSKFVKCLKLFCETATELEIKAKVESEILVEITDSLSTTECIIKTLYYPAAQLNQMPLSKAFSAPDSPEVATFMLKSSLASQMFALPDSTTRSSAPLAITIDYQAKVFEVMVEGAFGAVRSSMDFGLMMSQKSKFNLMEPFKASYPVSSFMSVLKAMALSSETSFRFKGNGMLSVQQAMTNSSAGLVETVVEFILQPMDEPSLLNE